MEISGRCFIDGCKKVENSVQAQQECVKFAPGGKLVEPLTKSDLEILGRVVADCSIVDRFYVGFNDESVEGTFVSTSTGVDVTEQLEQLWQDGEPDDIVEGRPRPVENCDCAIFARGNDALNDFPCDASLLRRGSVGYICELPKMEANPFIYYS